MGTKFLTGRVANPEHYDLDNLESALSELQAQEKVNIQSYSAVHPDRFGSLTNEIRNELDPDNRDDMNMKPTAAQPGLVVVFEIDENSNKEQTYTQEITMADAKPVLLIHVNDTEEEVEQIAYHAIEDFPQMNQIKARALDNNIKKAKPTKLDKEAALKARITELEANVESLVEENKKLMKDVKAADRNREHFEGQANTAIRDRLAEAASHEEEIAKLTATLDEVTADRDLQAGERERLTQAAIGHDNFLAQHKDDIAKKDDEIDDLKSQIEALNLAAQEGQPASADNSDEVASLRQQLRDAQAHLASALSNQGDDDQVAILQGQLESAQERIAELVSSQEQADNTQEVKGLRAELKQTKDELAQARAQLAQAPSAAPTPASSNPSETIVSTKYRSTFKNKIAKGFAIAGASLMGVLIATVVTAGILALTASIIMNPFVLIGIAAITAITLSAAALANQKAVSDKINDYSPDLKIKPVVVVTEHSSEQSPAECIGLSNDITDEDDLVADAGASSNAAP